MKAFTDINQSKKLAEILPLESADMHYYSGDKYNICFGSGVYEEIADWAGDGTPKPADIPCWSLAALLSVLPKEIEIDGQRYTSCLFPVGNDWLLKLWYNSNHIFTSPIAIFSDNPVDACYEMIIKLKEQKLL